MLDALKRYASGWVAQLFIALLVISFAVWGVSDIFSGFGSDAVARVGNVEVPVREFQRRYRIATQNLSRQLGQTITPQQAAQMGVPGQILNQLVTEATLDHAANQLGLGISNDVLGHKISSDPDLRAPSGNYDRAYLTQIIRAQDMTEDEFAINRRQQYIREQLVDAFGGGVAVPDAYMRALHEYRTEERTLSYVVVSAPPVSAIAEPSEAELAAYFEANKADWRAPEYRAIRYFTLSPDEIADLGEVTDEAAKERYDRQPGRFVEPEERRVEQIVFDNRAAAEAVASSLSAGKTFDQVVTERGLKPSDVDLGLVTRDKIVDPAVADAAFALAQGAVSPIVDGRFGPAIVHVTEIKPAVVTTFEEAKADLTREIAVERAQATILDLRDTIEDARAGGDTLTDAAARYDLKVVNVPAVDANGNGSDGNAIQDLPAGLASAAFESDVGLENNPIEPDNSSFVWYEVTDVTPAHDQTLAEVRDRVATAWKNAEREKRLAAEADAIKERLDNGDDLAAIAAAQSLTVDTATVTRITTPVGGLSAAAIAAAFSGPEGLAATAVGAEPMTRVVFTIDSVETPPYFSDAPTDAQLRQQFGAQIANDLLGLYASQLRSQTEVRLNQVALQQLLGVSPN